MKTKLILMALALGLPAVIFAQPDDSQRPQRPPFRQGDQQGEQGDRPPGRRMPPPPVMGALDANHDGVIDSAEIANASAALKTLDKNGDGQLTQEELRPAGGPGGPDGPGRPNGPGGPGGPSGPQGGNRPNRNGPPPQQ